MFRFENPEYFYFLLIIPISVALFVVGRIIREKMLARFGEKSLLSRLMPDYSNVRPILKLILWNIAMIILTIAMANPQIGTKLVKAKQKGIDMMICLDVSNSMLAEDVKPNRLENAKLAIRKLVEQLQGDRIGIIVFAGKAYIQLPITSDYAAAEMFINNINTRLIPTQGTALAQAISMAKASLQSETRSKAIILITDGEDHEGDVLTEAEKAAAEGIRIYTIGIGTPEGSPIPIVNEKGEITGYKKDAQGNTIITRLDEITLQKVASTGQGIYIRAQNTNQALRKIFEEINKLEKTEFDTQLFSEYESWYPYFLWIAFVLLVLEMLIPARKSHWAKRINLFGQ
ncbi:MAG TPA: VWA domain-containing protein [Bacteroidales bacterium]|jgi:Ca-activated chloride channel family protein|nr:VWA domain-containing protein [Bacteroidales bacterium]MDI9573177.1 VWA domain-containing protein [Bacteroidota bacterium]OQC59411.1 MAG: von Willebrand factor type A domain protein [Bacteroidetes bacterium ADurb.Bin012]MBP9511866.1 VWA domain-containing protein [Bacteroidales bacterium]MBP9588313.1 VWA domain-containing protein [Bacteroidales bacterium]